MTALLVRFRKHGADTSLNSTSMNSRRKVKVWLLTMERKLQYIDYGILNVKHTVSQHTMVKSVYRMLYSQYTIVSILYSAYYYGKSVYCMLYSQYTIVSILYSAYYGKSVYCMLSILYSGKSV